MKTLTSADRPIRLDLLPASAATWPGRVGLTIAPGKRYPGMEGMWERDLGADLARLREVYGASMLVPLCEVDELARIGIGDLYSRAEEAGLEVVAFPIVDGGVPASAEAVLPLVQTLARAAEDGRTVVIHCLGGLGRSGTVAACLLVTRGHGADAAIGIVRGARPGAVENEAQEHFVRAFAANWQSAG
jgi:hypothetical protein